MQVTLIDYTGACSQDPGRYAASILVYTKSTRLQMSPGLLDAIDQMPYDELMFNLKMMADTNPGSWEFVYLTFLIEGVTRAFTHQLVRTRTASYAQQTLRVLDVTGWKYATGPSIANDPTVKGAYHNTMDNTAQCYKFLLDAGVNIEDARGVLPLNILTNINISINMRNWVNLTRKRVSRRVQDEYTKVVEAMIIEVRKVYPWIDIFVNNNETKARKDLQDMIFEHEKLTKEEKTNMIKKLDIIMKDL